MSGTSTPELLVLHAVRTLGYADTARITTLLTSRALEPRALEPRSLRDEPDVVDAQVREHLLDAQAHGWVTCTRYAGDEGWSLTEAGKLHGEHLLAAELQASGTRPLVEAVHTDFLAWNAVVAETCTTWQLSEMGIGDHTADLPATLHTLQTAANALVGLEGRLRAGLTRFTGYHSRFSAAVDAAPADPAWISGIDRDSCHRVWFELHEDLIATLGLRR
ncbi:hypothetical protein [Kineococcus radiotolerans]|uniref:Transcriptional regulator n=1 Tax=Kineococcus radiotolerans (strain ATCC BAA-149 / DSM 14245 / SRS30216) TaxID=266940 RepID=A6WAS6_KINRD|nr:hypothetical protein [Kineococcus radiotolerans]ABS03915.1 conserved hypothetical protein [Kineococcus radiotolerans SRS30216 = ATCC BAA-149]